MSLKGSLDTFALPEVLRLLSDTAKSGELVVSDGHREGRLWFSSGAVVALDPGSAGEPCDVIFDMLRYEGGDFEFRTGEQPPEGARWIDEHRRNVAPEIEQAESRFGEWSSIVEVVPSLRHVVRLAAEAPGDGVHLDRFQWELVAAIGSGRAVGAVLVDRGVSEFDGCRALRGLVDSGLVTVDEPGEDEPAAGAGSDEAVVFEQPVAEQPVAEEPADEEPADEEPADEEPGSGAPLSEGGEVVADEDGRPWTGAATVTDEPLDDEPLDAAEPARSDEPEGEPAFVAGHGGHTNGSAPGPDDEPVAADPDPLLGEDHYAALRAAVMEAEDTFGAGAQDGDAPGAGDPDPGFEVGGVAADPALLAGFAEAGPADGRAALQALLAEVTASAPEPQPEDLDPVDDGLEDRGPWTNGELATLEQSGGWFDSEPDSMPEPGVDGSVAVGDHPDTDTDTGAHVLHFPAPLPAPGVHDDGFGPAGHTGGDGAAPGGPIGAGDPDVEAEPADEAEPAEEPINRGLLLKFLSSVRN